MTKKQLALLEEFLEGLLLQCIHSGKAPYNPEALTQIRNVIHNCIDLGYIRRLKFLNLRFDVYATSHIKRILTRKTHHEYDKRATCIHQCGLVIAARASKLPLLIGKYDDNPTATAILDWRMKN
jgi:hypothetical protein